MSEKKCTCTYTSHGLPMDNSGCAIHTKQAYRCDCCGCLDYRPRSQPDPDKGHWPLCVCGHIAQDHNSEAGMVTITHTASGHVLVEHDRKRKLEVAEKFYSVGILEPNHPVPAMQYDIEYVCDPEMHGWYIAVCDFTSMRATIYHWHGEVETLPMQH